MSSKLSVTNIFFSFLFFLPSLKNYVCENIFFFTLHSGPETDAAIVKIFTFFFFSRTALCDRLQHASRRAATELNRKSFLGQCEMKIFDSLLWKWKKKMFFLSFSSRSLFAQKTSKLDVSISSWIMLLLIEKLFKDRRRISSFRRQKFKHSLMSCTLSKCEKIFQPVFLWDSAAKYIMLFADKHNMKFIACSFKSFPFNRNFNIKSLNFLPGKKGSTTSELNN